MNTLHFSIDQPLRIGLIGTGYAAKLRAETFQADSRTLLTAVAGHDPEKTRVFCQTYGAEPYESWADLIDQAAVDLLVISTVNRDHGAIARRALEAGLPVVVEYPLALDVAEAATLIGLARDRNLLLHVEHIELLGGMHQALKRHLDQVGSTFYCRYATINPQRPAPRKWTYDPELFGFPLMGALSRIHRLTDLFGPVATVSCQARFWDVPSTSLPSPYYTACLCTAHLRFRSGLVAEITYGKGETLWQAERRLEVHGEKGALIFQDDQGTLIQPQGSQAIEVGSRRGLFAKDTAIVLDHLAEGQPLYVTAEESLYALKVADAAQQSALTGKTVEME